MRHIELIADGVIATVKEYVSGSLAPIESRLVRLESIPVPQKGETGSPGKDAEVDYPRIHERLATDMAEAIKQLPPAERGPQGEKGIPGDPGKDAEPIDVDSIVAQVVMLVPAPKDGEPGANGKDADPEQVKALVEAQAEHAAEVFAERLIKRLQCV